MLLRKNILTQFKEENKPCKKVSNAYTTGSKPRHLHKWVI